MRFRKSHEIIDVTEVADQSSEQKERGRECVRSSQDDGRRRCSRAVVVAETPSARPSGLVNNGDLRVLKNEHASRLQVHQSSLSDGGFDCKDNSRRL